MKLLRGLLERNETVDLTDGFDLPFSYEIPQVLADGLFIDSGYVC